MRVSTLPEVVTALAGTPVPNESVVPETNPAMTERWELVLESKSLVSG